MTGGNRPPGKPKLEFFSKRVGFATVLVGGAAYYFFSYRPHSKRRRHLEREAEAQEYWRLHKSELEKTK